MAKSIKRNFLYNILLNILKVMFPLITAPYVSRVLEPDGVGLFNFANTYAGWFALFAALGIPLYGIREVAKIKEDIDEQTRFISETISISVVATFVCSILMFLTLFFIPQLNENYVIFLVSGIILYMTPLKVDWFFQGKEEFGYITFRSLVIKALSVVLLFLLVREKSDLLFYVALNAAAVVLNEIWNFIKLYQSGIRPYFTLSGGRHIKPLFILFSSSIAISVYTSLGTLMLGFMADYNEVGYYNCAAHLSWALVPIVTSLAAVVLPRVSKLKEEKNWSEINKLMNKSFSIVSFMSFPIAFGVMVVAPVFVPLFFGEQFYGTIIPLQIIIFAIVAIGFNNLAGIQILLGFGLDKAFLYSLLTGTVSNFILNLILIPFWGASGAAISSVFAETLILCVMLVFIYKNTPIRFYNYKDTAVNLTLSLSFMIVSFITGVYSSGWPFVLITIVGCTLVYLSGQFIAKTSSSMMLIEMIKFKYKFHDENLL